VIFAGVTEVWKGKTAGSTEKERDPFGMPLASLRVNSRFREFGCGKYGCRSWVRVGVGMVRSSWRWIAI
jgi:hypothetical protein